MNPRNTIIIGTVLLVAVWGVLGWMFFSRSSSSAPAQNSGGTLDFFSSPVPVAQTSNKPAGAGKNTGAIEVGGVSGTVSVSDFRVAAGVASTTQGDSGLWWFPGSEATSTPPANRAYDIFYFPDSRLFSVVLLNEPLADARKKAAADLEAKLGLSEQDICALRAEVLVPYMVSSLYSAKNIGFPGCPGATALPGD